MRFSTRWRVARSVGAFAGGLVLGAAMLPIPGLHLASWVAPVLTLGVALYLWRARVRLDRVRGPCPSCAAPVAAHNLGLVGKEEIWIRCDGCGTPIVVTLDVS